MKKSVLITGGTKGIGRACAEAFVAEGYAVTVVARTAADLEAIGRSLGVATILADLGTPAGVGRVPANYYDVVVLNAATFQVGTLLAEDDLFSRLFSVNVSANHHLARRLLPRLIEEDRGHLIVIGSTGTDHWEAHMTAYVATKYALRGLFLGWQKELALTRVRCTLVAPGATLTSSWEGETPPPGILQPEEVAIKILEIINEGIGGRVTIDGRAGR